MSTETPAKEAGDAVGAPAAAAAAETTTEKNSSEGSAGGGQLEDPPLFQFLTGMKEDLEARAPLYGDDWSRPRSFFTVINATTFAFVIQLIPALIFAELMDRETEGNLASAEV